MHSQRKRKAGAAGHTFVSASDEAESEGQLDLLRRHRAALSSHAQTGQASGWYRRGMFARDSGGQEASGAADSVNQAELDRLQRDFGFFARPATEPHDAPGPAPAAAQSGRVGGYVAAWEQSAAGPGDVVRPVAAGADQGVPSSFAAVATDTAGTSASPAVPPLAPTLPWNRRTSLTIPLHSIVPLDDEFGPKASARARRKRQPQGPATSQPAPQARTSARGMRGAAGRSERSGRQQLGVDAGSGGAAEGQGRPHTAARNLPNLSTDGFGGVSTSSDVADDVTESVERDFLATSAENVWGIAPRSPGDDSGTDADDVADDVALGDDGERNLAHAGLGLGSDASDDSDEDDWRHFVPVSSIIALHELSDDDDDDDNNDNVDDNVEDDDDDNEADSHPERDGDNILLTTPGHADASKPGLASVNVAASRPEVPVLMPAGGTALVDPLAAVPTASQPPQQRAQLHHHQQQRQRTGKQRGDERPMTLREALRRRDSLTADPAPAPATGAAGANAGSGTINSSSSGGGGGGSSGHSTTFSSLRPVTRAANSTTVEASQASTTAVAAALEQLLLEAAATEDEVAAEVRAAADIAIAGAPASSALTAGGGAGGAGMGVKPLPSRFARQTLTALSRPSVSSAGSARWSLGSAGSAAHTGGRAAAEEATGGDTGTAPTPRKQQARRPGYVPLSRVLPARPASRPADEPEQHQQQQQQAAASRPASGRRAANAALAAASSPSVAPQGPAGPQGFWPAPVPSAPASLPRSAFGGRRASREGSALLQGPLLPLAPPSPALALAPASAYSTATTHAFGEAAISAAIADAAAAAAAEARAALAAPHPWGPERADKVPRGQRIFSAPQQLGGGGAGDLVSGPYAASQYRPPPATAWGPPQGLAEGGFPTGPFGESRPATLPATAVPGFRLGTARALDYAAGGAFVSPAPGSSHSSRGSGEEGGAAAAASASVSAAALALTTAPDPLSLHARFPAFAPPGSAQPRARAELLQSLHALQAQWPGSALQPTGDHFLVTPRVGLATRGESRQSDGDVDVDVDGVILAQVRARHQMGMLSPPGTAVSTASHFPSSTFGGAGLWGADGMWPGTGAGRPESSASTATSTSTRPASSSSSAWMELNPSAYPAPHGFAPVDRGAMTSRPASSSGAGGQPPLPPPSPHNLPCAPPLPPPSPPSARESRATSASPPFPEALSLAGSIAAAAAAAAASAATVSAVGAQSAASARGQGSAGRSFSSVVPSVVGASSSGGGGTDPHIGDPSGDGRQALSARPDLGRGSSVRALRAIPGSAVAGAASAKTNQIRASASAASLAQRPLSAVTQQQQPRLQQQLSHHQQRGSGGRPQSEAPASSPSSTAAPSIQALALRPFATPQKPGPRSNSARRGSHGSLTPVSASAAAIQQLQLAVGGGQRALAAPSASWGAGGAGAGAGAATGASPSLRPSSQQHFEVVGIPSGTSPSAVPSGAATPQRAGSQTPGRAGLGGRAGHTRTPSTGSHAAYAAPAGGQGQSSSVARLMAAIASPAAPSSSSPAATAAASPSPLTLPLAQGYPGPMSSAPLAPSRSASALRTTANPGLRASPSFSLLAQGSATGTSTPGTPLLGPTALSGGGGAVAPPPQLLASGSSTASAAPTSAPRVRPVVSAWGAPPSSSSGGGGGGSGVVGSSRGGAGASQTPFAAATWSTLPASFGPNSGAAGAVGAAAGSGESALHVSGVGAASHSPRTLPHHQQQQQQPAPASARAAFTPLQDLSGRAETWGAVGRGRRPAAPVPGQGAFGVGAGRGTITLDAGISDSDDGETHVRVPSTAVGPPITRIRSGAGSAVGAGASNAALSISAASAGGVAVPSAALEMAFARPPSRQRPPPEALFLAK